MWEGPIGKTFAAHALRTDDWAERAGYPSRLVPLTDRIPLALTDARVGHIWQGVRDDLLDAYRTGGRIVEAGPCYIVMHDWSGGKGLDSSSFLFSTKGDLHFEDMHWLPTMNGQGPIYQVLDAETGKVFIDLSGPRPVIDIDEPHFHLFGNENFGHWVCDVLGRLLAAELFAPEIARLPLLVDKILDPQRQFLKRIGFDNPLRLLHRPGEAAPVYRFHRLFITSPPPCTLAFPLIQARVLQAVGEGAGDRGGRYFLSRRHLFPRHRIENEPAVESCLAAFGFETLHSGDSDPVGDMRRMRAADIVVLPYGAALGNLPMTGPRCQIILLGPDFLLTDRFEHPILRYFRRYLFPFLDRIQLIAGTAPPNRPPPAADAQGPFVFNMRSFDEPFEYDVKSLTLAVMNAEKALIRRR
jgi:hypothetical protein